MGAAKTGTIISLYNVHESRFSLLLHVIHGTRVCYPSNCTVYVYVTMATLYIIFSLDTLKQRGASGSELVSMLQGEGAVYCSVYCVL